MDLHDHDCEHALRLLDPTPSGTPTSPEEEELLAGIDDLYGMLLNGLHGTRQRRFFHLHYAQQRADALFRAADEHALGGAEA